MIFDTTWTQLKSFASAKSLSIQYIESDSLYYVFIYDGPFGLKCSLNKDSSDETVDFEDNFKASANKAINKRAADTKAMLVSPMEPEGAFETYISHDWCDKTTWWQKSVRVTGGSASAIDGLDYTLPHQFVIDLTHGKVSLEDSHSSAHLVKVYDDTNEITEFNVNYESGVITLLSSPSGVVTFDYSYATTSEWSVSYESGLLLRINKAEVQFTKDVNFRPMEFSVWIVHPVAGITKVESIMYKSIKDIVNISNLGFSVPAFSGLSNEVVIFPFEYQRPIKLNPDLQMYVQLKIVDDEPMVGEFATASLYVAEVTI